MATWLIGFGTVALLAALHPFSTYPLSLLALRRWARRPLRPDPSSPREPELAILLCAYNEEHVIQAKLKNLLMLQERYPGIAIYVYVDAATDRTLELLEPYRDRIHLEVASERTGKARGMNRLMSLVREPIVVFTDANVLIDLNAPARLMDYFADPSVGCVTGHLLYTNADASATARSGSLYWRLEEWTKRLESEIGSCMGADGSLFAIRRDLHAATPADFCDDMYVSMRVLCAGRRVVQADDVNAFQVLVTAQAEEFRRKVRIACQAFNVHRALWSAIRQLDALTLYEYLSHKFLRWLAVFSLLVAALSIELALLIHAGVLPALAAGGLAILALGLGWLGWVKPLGQVWDILVAFAGTGLGVLYSLRGHKFATWTPAATSRETPKLI